MRKINVSWSSSFSSHTENVPTALTKSRMVGFFYDQAKEQWYRQIFYKNGKMSKKKYIETDKTVTRKISFEIPKELK